MTMRFTALSVAPPAPHWEAAWSSTTPVTSVAAPNPWTVPVPLRINSTIPRFGVTETALAVKLASNLPLAALPAAPWADWAGALGQGGSLHPVRDPQLAQDPGDVDAGGLGADVQLGPDLRIGAPRRQQPQHGQLTFGEQVGRERLQRARSLRVAARRRGERDAGSLRERADLRQQRRVAVGGGRG